MTKKDQKLKNLFEKMQDPQPEQKARDNAIKASMEEYDRSLHRQNEKKVKGIDIGESLTGKIKRLISFKGVPVMTRPIYATTLVAAIAVGVVMSLMPMYRDNKTIPSIPLKTPDIAVQSEIPKIAAKEKVQHANEAALKRESKKADAPFPTREMGGSLAKNIVPSPTDQIAEPQAGRPYSTEGDSTISLYKAPAMSMVRETEIIPHHYERYVGRDQFDTKENNPLKLVSEEPVSTFSIDVDTASYAFMRRQINHGMLPQKNSVRIEELINYFDYDYAVPADRSQPFEPTVVVYPTPWNDQTQLLHIGIKGYDIAVKEKPRSNLVFLLDVSGSMNNPDKLPLLKNAFRMLVDNLDQNDSVAIVVYAGAAGVILEPTKITEKTKIWAALDSLQAGGSTAGGQGIHLAYSLAEAHFDTHAVNRVILATDGDFNVGITNREELKSYIERKRKSGIFLSVLGFGQGNYNDALMQTLAQNGNGNAAYIDNLNEARKVLVEEASSTLFPIAKDVKIQIEFNPNKVVDYRLIGYETRILKREDFNNDQVDAGEIGSGHSVTAIYEITTVESKQKLIDDLRYQPGKNINKADESNEYAFLKIRYKLPKESKSKLINRPITIADEFKQNIPKEIQFAASVAAFGQLLKGLPYTKNFGYDDVIGLAEPARGRDQFGYRSEFINLVRLAKSARGM